MYCNGSKGWDQRLFGCACVCAARVRSGYRGATAGSDGGEKQGDGMKRMHRGEAIAPEPAFKQGRGRHTRCC